MAGVKRESDLSQCDSMFVGDVGGTHARFAIVDTSDPPPWPIRYRLDLESDYPGFIQALQDYVDRAGVHRLPPSAVIAVAGPVTGGRVCFTNRKWQVSEDDLKDFGFQDALLINDFAALAFAVDILAANDLRTIGPELRGLDGEPVSIVGAGTGFGVSCLVRSRNRPVSLTTEGGHIGFAPSDDQEIAVLRSLMRQFGRVSIERILSGPGLENLYQTLEVLAGRQPATLSAAEVVANASIGDTGCRAALTMFCSIFGAVAGDIALMHGARGGVFIAGGIALKIREFLAQSPFRTQFESKGRLSSFVKSIPTKLIVDSDASLLGAARAGLASPR